MCIKKCSMIIYFISSSHSKDKYYSTELIFVSKLYYAYFTHFEWPDLVNNIIITAKLLDKFNLRISTLIVNIQTR